MLRLRLLLPFVILLTVIPRPSFAARPSRSKLKPCKVDGWEASFKEKKQLDALCGTYQVWENREAKAGRKLTLNIVLLPALSSSPAPDPVFYLSGGPGGASTRAVYNDPLRQERDLVFVDQRGTGEPDRLSCALAGRDDDLQSSLGEQFPLDAVRRCRDELGKKYDLTRYTVAAAVDDFDEIRAWLGYGKVNLIGGSYGTRTAQIYLRRHPKSVRTATLWGVVPNDEPVAYSHAAGAQRVLDLTLGGCEEDAACHAKFPDVRKDFQAVMDRLSQGPVEVEVPHPKTGKVTPVRLSREVVAEGIRNVLYSAEASAALPVLFHQAAAGDWKPLGATAVAAMAGLEDIITRGLFFSVTCAEDIPFIDPAQIAAHTAGSFLGDYRIRRQTAACALWPKAKIDPAQREPLHSDVPVLLINGDLDPVTPPDFGRLASRFLTQSLHIVEPFAGHEESPPCVEGLADEFVRRGTVQGLDTSCLREMKRTPFLLEVPKEAIKPFL